MDSASSKKLLTIIVLRGGKENHETSIKEGANVLSLLRKHGYDPMDVYIDEDDVWHHKGVPTEKHHVFSGADAYVDLTRSKEVSHHDLAKRMGLLRLLSNENSLGQQDRENIYRILRQKNILVPNTQVIRARSNVGISHLQEIWRKMHTPYLVRSLFKKGKTPSVLVSSFDKFKESIENTKDEDVMMMTYRNSMPISVAVLPNYRGEKLYTPIAVQTLVSSYQAPNDTHVKKLFIHASNDEKKEISDVAKKVYEALDIKDHALVDLIKTPKGYMVVEVQTNPSLLPDSRFSQSLESTGADIGHFIHTRLERVF